MRPCLRWCAPALAILVSAAHLDAQWRVAASAGGVSHETLGAAASSSSAMLALGYEGTRWLYISAGAPLDSDGVLWGAAGIGGRETVPRLPVDVGVAWSLLMHAYGPTAGGATGNGLVADALPFVSAGIGPVRMEIRSGLAHYRSAFAGETLSRTGHDSGLSLELRPHQRISLSGDGRLLRIDGASYGYAGMSAEVAIPLGALWVHGGRWSDEALPDPDWGAGAEIEFASRTSLSAAYRQDATDPLYWNTTRKFWSVGVSRRLGGGRPIGAGAAPIAAPLTPEMRSGYVVFRIPASASETAPFVAGDFNQWTPVAMRLVDGDWVARMRLEPGIHHYAFRDAEGHWFVPESVPNRVDDGFGGTNAIMVVPEASPR